VHPKNVAGLVLIDVGFDDPDDMAKEFPGAQAWGGPEHIDWVDAARLQSKIRMPIADFPVLIITADHNEASPPPPSAWRKLSPNAREIVKHGGHDLHHEIPDELATDIRSLLATLR
jgi:pimeloyl-ACP methyl ester carboxylesterase